MPVGQVVTYITRHLPVNCQIVTALNWIQNFDDLEVAAGAITGFRNPKIKGATG